jgi:thiamine-phosphate pyrophosphorylase
MVDTAFGAPAAVTHALLAGGCRVLQLRAKSATTEERIGLIQTLLPVTRAAGALLIVNDDLEAAREGGADGLHLGQDDGSLAAARRVLGPGALLGRSTHDLEQVTHVAPEADYLGFGPVFPTATKATGYDPRGLELLRRAVATSPRPVVAIGGVSRARLSQVRAAGAQHWAVISDILEGSEDSAVWTERARSLRA